MSYDKDDYDYEPTAPKKADVLIKSTQSIVRKQKELSEQTKLAVAKIDEAVSLCNKNSQEATNILERSTEMFDKLHEENIALKQELLYLAKQSENIYAGLADKLNDIQLEHRQGGATVDLEALSERLADVDARLADLAARMDALYSEKSDGALNDKFAILYDKVDGLAADMARPSGSNREDIAEILEKVNRLSETMRKNEGAHSMLADKFEILSMRVEQFGYAKVSSPYAQPAYAQPAPVYPAPVHTIEIDYDKLASKVADLISREAASPDAIAAKVAEIMPAREALSPDEVAAKVVELLPSQEEVSSDIIAAKVAELMSVRETVSPDYIASKVAEQIIMPEQVGAEINTAEIAKEVASLIDVQPAMEEAAPLDEDALVERLAGRVSELVAPVGLDEDAIADKLAEKLSVSAPVEFDEDALADKICEKLSISVTDEVPAVAPVAFDEDALVNKICEKLSLSETDEVAPAAGVDEDALVEKIVARLGGLITAAAVGSSQVNIDEEDLADNIALKVGSLNPEDFEIIVDDAGCASLSKEIAEKLDYNAIATIIADKLREILDLNAANAPDYEDMAERISEKITVAGINEDAIADKAAAVLSNYLPEFDTEEIVDKVTGAVIDVISAMPQPTLDSEAICNEISERLIEKQDDNNYDIVIDDDGISRITAIVSEEIEKDTDARFDRLEETIEKLTEMFTAEDEEDEDIEEPEDVEEVEEDAEDIGEAEDEPSLSEIVASEIERGTAERFDKVDSDIAKIYELVSSIVVEEDESEPEEIYTEGEQVVCDDADYSRLSEIVASEIEKGVASRLDGVEEKLTALSDMLTVEDEELDAEAEETADEAEETEEVEEVEEYADEGEDRLSVADMVAQMQTNLSARFDGVEEKISALTDMLTVEDEEYDEEAEEVEETEAEEVEEVEADDGYEKLSALVASRFDSVDEALSALNERITAGEAETGEDGVDVDKLSAAVSAEVERGVAARFDSVEDDIRRVSALIGGIAVAGAASGSAESAHIIDAHLLEQLDRINCDVKKISEFIEGQIPVLYGERLDKISVEVGRVATLVDNGFTVETAGRLDRLTEEVEKLSLSLCGEGSAETNARIDALRSEVGRLSALLTGDGSAQTNSRIDALHEDVKKLSSALESGAAVAAKEQAVAVQTAEPAPVIEDEEELVTVSNLINAADVEDDEDGDDDFLLSALDMDKFSDDERMPGELDIEGGVDFENMMKYNRSFIARIIQSEDDTKQYYGEVKHALLSYKKVNSNVAWGNERFNKGRETIARMKIRGKTLVVYLALDPNEYKTSVYHHADVSDNKSVLGTPMMIKVKSPLGVRKAIRLIDEMLAKRGGEKREIPERDYAAMYPYENIEELIEDGLVKDVRKK